MLGGVCAGLAERLDLDVSLVRVAFVVLAFVWGLGVVVYVAMWALVPRAGDDEGAPGVEEPTGSWLAFLLLGALLVLGVLVLASWWGGPRWGGGVGLLWAVAVVGVLVARGRCAASSARSC
jgi:phage shock protein PspC (stress-responsive transcriptional regulator)